MSDTQYLDGLIDQLLMPPPSMTQAQLERLHKEAAEVIHMYKKALQRQAK